MEKTYHGITTNDLHFALSKKVNELVDSILSYESDTFSSEGSELTPVEAEEIAFRLIRRNIEQMTSNEIMDGTMIDSELYELRESF